jgi:hypothetical protein
VRLQKIMNQLPETAKKQLRKVVTGDEKKSIRSHVGELPIKAQKNWRKLVTGDADKRIRDVALDKVEKIKLGARRHADKFKQTISSRPIIKLKDRISFFLGVLVMCVTEWVLLVTPESFWMLYILIAIPAIVVRVYTYCDNYMGYFLIDFCYFVNLSCVLQIFLAPENVSWMRINFVCANGPLAVASIAWRNSLVFHSYDKITSLIIHQFPAILCYNQRWFPDGIKSDLNPDIPLTLVFPRLVSLCTKDGALEYDGGWMSHLWGYTAYATPPPCSLGMPVTEILTNCVYFYALWQLLYLLITEVLFVPSNDKYSTSLRWLMKDRRNLMNKVALGLCRRVGVLKKHECADPETLKGKAIFVVAQFVYTIVTLLPTKFLYENWLAHFSFLAVIFMIIVWNGASYYFDVFTVRYENSLPTAEGADIVYDPDNFDDCTKE